MFFLTKWTIQIHDVEIIPLYDPPHLLKCIRDNFAKWSHLITALEMVVCGICLGQSIPELTTELMMHVFSKAVPSFMDTVAKFGGKPEIK